MEGNKSGSSFCDKSSDSVLLAISNLWNNIQIVSTHILKHNVSNLISLIRYLDFETLHYHFEHISDKVIYHIFNNIKKTKRIHFPTQKSAVIALLKYDKTVFLRTLFALVNL